MILRETSLLGAYFIEIERIADERGFFARSYCEDEFAKYNLEPCTSQCNISFNKKKGTLRGMHFQKAPQEEAKLVRCTLGAIYDVIIDLRPNSPNYCQWFAAELTAENRGMLYIPKGFAHGFQTLEDNTEVFYQMSAKYSALHATGLRWNDPVFTIEWPTTVTNISPKDQNYPNFSP